MEGAGGAGMWPQGVLASSAAAMLGLGTGTQQQQQEPVGQQPQYSLFQQLHGGGFQHHEAQPMAMPAPEGDRHEEEEAIMGAGAGNDDGGVAGPGFVWARVKWTDAMVRLLIMVVYNAGPGEDAKASSSSSSSPAPAPAPGKKGKWRSASQAMAERGFAVSPQQCEDKFNDLNKRYKRAVELLGGNPPARAVLQNPALLDAAIAKLAPAARELARKLLSPKQLFGFREMCLYHNHKPVKPVAAAALATITEVEDEEEEGEQQQRGNPKRRRGESSSSKAKGVAEEEEEDDPEETDDEDAPLFSAMAVAQLQGKLDAMGDTEEARRWLQRRAMEVREKLKACGRRGRELDEHRNRWERFKEAKEREMDAEELGNLRAHRKLLALKGKEIERRIAEQKKKKQKQKQVGFGFDCGRPRAT